MGYSVEQGSLETLALFERFRLTRTLERILQFVVEPLDLTVRFFGFFSPSFRVRRKLAGSQCRNQVSDKGNPIVRISDRESTEGWEKEKVETDHAE